MPLIASTPPPSATPAPSRPQPKRITWTSPRGDVLDLCDDSAGYRSLPGRSGFGMVPREVLYDNLPGGGGALRNIRDQVRVLSIPLRVHGWTQPDYLARLRRLQRAVRHRVGGQDLPGTITVYLPDGTHRSIAAYYQGGLDAEEPVDDLLTTAQNFPRLEFLCLDPYWAGGSVSASWKSGAGSTFFGTMPVHLSASQVLGSVTLDVPGDADTHPVWTIVGPGSPTLANDTTGRTLAFKAGSPIVAGRTVTIDTRDEALTVEDDMGADLYSSLQEWPDMWALEPGVNHLTVSVAGATAATQVSVTAAARWQTGW